jgi:hypothetical protein
MPVSNQQIPSQQRSKQTNVARVPHVVGQSQQQTVQTLSNSEEKNNKKEQLHVDGSKLGQSVSGSNNKMQSNSNGDEFNTQQQISPLYMLTAGTFILFRKFTVPKNVFINKTKVLILQT